jgi:hypothetical protein
MKKSVFMRLGHMHIILFSSENRLTSSQVLI